MPVNKQVKCGPTHHNAYDCREAYIKQLEKVYRAAQWLVKDAGLDKGYALAESERKLVEALAEVKCVK